MSNTKEEVKSIDDLIGKLYAKIKQRDKEIESLKNELAAAKDEIASAKKDYDYMFTRLERIADMSPKATDTSQGRGFNAEKTDKEIDEELRNFINGPRDLSDPKQLERAHCIWFIP